MTWGTDQVGMMAVQVGPQRMGQPSSKHQRQTTDGFQFFPRIHQPSILPEGDVSLGARVGIAFGALAGFTGTRETDGKLKFTISGRFAFALLHRGLPPPPMGVDTNPDEHKFPA